MVHEADTGDVGAARRANVLVVNDDGIAAAGLVKVVEALASTGKFDVYVVAPDKEMSATSHSISIHNAVSATPKTVPGATRAFASSGTPADCTMLGISVLYRAKRFDYIVSGVNRGDNLGLHVVYSGTVAGAREGAMRTGAVGVAVSLDSYSRSADYSEAARFTAELVSAVHDTPGLTETLRGVVLNVNVPNLPKDAIRGVKLTKPGVSCTQAEWVRVPGDESPNGKGPDSDSDGDWRHDGAFADGVDELPIPHTGAGLDTNDTWEKGTRWFRNKPGPARDDQREGFDKKALGDGFVSVSVLASGYATVDFDPRKIPKEGATVWETMRALVPDKIRSAA
mmetsp:Transcript_9925/g.27641  ORF Transcript_9925/g.27641 Transcript_9925/m.27641 type:complete len:339 (-) Transcript_9925:127-1143(-)